MDEAEYQYLLTETKKQEKQDKKMADKLHFGLLAQDVVKVFPEIVDYDEEKDVYGIRYLELIPVLIEAIKSQQEEIDALKAEISSLQPSSSPKSMGLVVEDQKQTMEEAVLYPNDPNPFQTLTKIRYNIPSSAKSAIIIMYTLNGVQIKNYPISARGEGFIQINASELKAGMYIYQLLVDQKEIASYKMILTP